jgi:hypothetical protein
MFEKEWCEVENIDGSAHGRAEAGVGIHPRVKAGEVTGPGAQLELLIPGDQNSHLLEAHLEICLLVFRTWSSPSREGLMGQGDRGCCQEGKGGLDLKRVGLNHKAALASALYL